MKNFYGVLSVYIIAVVVGSGIVLFSFYQNYFFTSFLLLLIVFVFVVGIYFLINHRFRAYDRVIYAILQKDFSIDFSKSKSSLLFKLYTRLKNEENHLASKDLIYRSIFDRIKTGVIILQKQDQEWNIFLINDYFSNYFNIPKFSKWCHLKTKIPSFCESIEKKNFQDFKQAINVRLNNEKKQTFLIQTARSRINYSDHYMILLDSVQQIIENKEREVWTNLIGVISHELMNSLSPIRSLSENLSETLQKKRLTDEDRNELKKSIKVIVKRSDHLRQFVESYRKLSILPTPEKTNLKLSEIVENTIHVMRSLFKEKGVTFSNLTDDYALHADKAQMEQALINLLLNALSAVEQTQLKQVELSSEKTANHLFIHISDSGKGIDKQIEDKVFLPFFTTRSDGSGIGLTLSKNIAEAHGGYLSFKQLPNKTVFTICLLDVFKSN